MQDQPPSYLTTPLGSPSPPPDPLPKLFDDLLDALLYFSKRTNHECISYSFARCIVERDDFLSAPLRLQAAAHYFYAGGLCRDHNGDRGYKNSRAAMDAMNKASEAGERYHVLMPDWDKWYADMYGRKVTCSEAYTIHGMGYPEESLPPVCPCKALRPSR
jgi:hypothetical protein